MKHPACTVRACVRALLLLPATLAAGCAVGPNYHRPTATITPVYKENQNWKPANPRQIPADQPWWSIYDDPLLDGLERQVVVNNQTLKQAEAAYRAAQAVIMIDRGTLLPDLTIGGSDTHAGAAGGQVNSQNAQLGGRGSGFTTPKYIKYATASVQAQASWTLDIWGKIRREVESDTARAQASAADVAAALLSAQVSLAEDYFRMRAAEQEERMYQTYLADLEQSLQITQNQVRAGITTLADVYQAQTLLENTQVAAINVNLTRATFEHAIATLIGKVPEQLSLPQGSFNTAIPVVPVGLPSQLLERRPDIAAAERTVASENALIGVAESAWFPNLTLTGSAGFTSSKLAGLLSAANTAWSFGPQVAETIFNGGARIGQNREARANYDQSVASYRQTVLSAFEAVENDLVTLRVLEQSQGLQVTAVGAARLSENLTLNQYKSGIVSFTSVITAQTTRLESEINLLSIQSEQLVTSVDLVSQTGGGWNASDLQLANRGVPKS
ncbi:MAG TPA: efflux transporter outer membrane subunit [Steroidobacteraceae bacterium]|nr:efflux transporter outer membrane subunit [Steroidobacteraceae bacterium]